ncbi:MAG: VIT domain-containing protein [Aggregatilineales bacterium]
MKGFRLIFTFSLFFVFALGGQAQRIDPCPPPPICPPRQPCPPLIMPECFVPGVFTNPDWLKITHHHVDVTIENQIARTSVDMAFVNDGMGLAEGTFIFPLPRDAAVDTLIMYINDVPIEARILAADEARSIYDAIVRQYRDPALLEYLGRGAVQANVFPIPPGETRRIVISYSQALEVDNGLLHYVYPMNTTQLTSRRPIERMSIAVQVNSADPISIVYSPSHPIAISRADDERSFRAGFEQNLFLPDQDFSLFYGIANETISLNLLTYRESATADGFFMLLVQPPLQLPEAQIVPRDLIIVLDQSGSMNGPKWSQAQAATRYVLENLNERDRFNVILFSTGWRLFSEGLEPVSAAREAIDWVEGQFAEGGTDINGALMTALAVADAERPTAILFITDGLPTEGVTRTDDILANLSAAAGSNVRIFNFGVGDDVDTFLLDAIARDFRGSSSYVRPSERVDEAVASLYNRIGAPVMTDVQLTINGVRVDSIYPAAPLPDLFAGTQLTIVGRYRDGVDNARIELSGMVDGERQTYIYDGLSFRARAGGESFIPRLWATRRIGDLLNAIRLNGENPELIDSVVSLSVRYGIITPYTSFLIEEDDILTQTGRDRAAAAFQTQAQSLTAASSGAAAVDAADTFGGMAAAEAPVPMMMPTMAASGIGGQTTPSVMAQSVEDRTFILRDGVWVDTAFDPETMTTETVVFLSDEYFALIETRPGLIPFFALGERVIVVYDGVVYEVTAE